MNCFYLSNTYDGYKNLALDEWFIDSVGDDDIVLYLYINKNAVIIGKNQNPWKECDFDSINRDGVQIVRRITGGGAVYHDEGNLNFSFIAGKNRYDKEKNFALIVRALESLGVNAEISGRNDIESDGKKISGNAFCRRKDNFQHHGTLLVSSNLSKLSNYLTVDERKIKSKGISSVRARVCNISEINPDVTVELLKEKLKSAFKEEFGEYYEFIPDEDAKKEISLYEEKHRSWEWRIGQTPKFDIEIDERLSFGGIQIFLSLNRGKIEKVKVFSDAIDENIAEKTENLLLGINFEIEDVKKHFAVSTDAKFAEICDMLCEKIGGKNGK